MDLLVLSMAKKYADKKVPAVTPQDEGKVLAAGDGVIEFKEVDSVVTEGSSNLITSGGVYDLLGEIEEDLSEV